MTEESNSVIIFQNLEIYIASHTRSVTHSRSALRLNVGFLLNLTVGSSREFLFDFPRIHLQPDLDLTDLTGKTVVTRTPQGLLVNTKMQASCLAECGRCLTEFEQILKVDFTELYYFPGRAIGETDMQLPEDSIIDLEPVLREYMLLEVPINPVCNTDCEGLCPVCGESLTGNSHNHDDEAIDPRLAVLKELLDEDQ